MAEERLIVVDERNRATGFGEKDAVHRAGLLHRAFSIFLVDDRGRILLQRRSAQKYHSGGLWANSCCGHPRPGEQTLAAARRRLREELGAEGPLTFGFFSRYRADLDHGMQENEFVYVYFAPLGSALRPDPAEVSELEFVSVDELRRRIARQPKAFAYWLKHYFQNHFADIVRLASAASRTARPAPDFAQRKQAGRSGASVARRP
jgi:isopentenyl-diphosphate delta-isomerase